MAEFFPYAVDYRFAPFWAPFGVRPKSDGVTITDDGQVAAKYGLIKLSTPLENVDGAHITSNYRWWTSIGARMSFVDDGLTFGTNHKAGVCIHFRDKVPSTYFGRRHSALTVTVADLDGLVRSLSN